MKNKNILKLVVILNWDGNVLNLTCNTSLDLLNSICCALTCLYLMSTRFIPFKDTLVDRQNNTYFSVYHKLFAPVRSYLLDS